MRELSAGPNFCLHIWQDFNLGKGSACLCRLLVYTILKSRALALCRKLSPCLLGAQTLRACSRRKPDQRDALILTPNLKCVVTHVRNNSIGSISEIRTNLPTPGKTIPLAHNSIPQLNLCRQTNFPLYFPNTNSTSNEGQPVPTGAGIKLNKPHFTLPGELAGWLAGRTEFNMNTKFVSFMALTLAVDTFLKSSGPRCKLFYFLLGDPFLSLVRRRRTLSFCFN